MSRCASPLMFGLMVLGLSSCGSGDKPDAQANKQNDALVPRGVRKAADPPPAANPQPAPAKKQPEATAPKAKAEENPIDPATDPNDIFVIAGNAFEYDVAGQALETRAADQFSAEVPSSGDFVQFSAVVPPREEPAPTTNKLPLPAGFSAIAAEGFSESGHPWRIRCEKDKSVMALVPAGTSPIGTDSGPAEAGPPLTVYLDNFYIDTTEVTLAQFATFRNAAKAERGRTLREPLNATSPPDHPALGVAWSEIHFYLTWSGKELPNEAEWEKAARGEKGFEHPWGAGRVVWARSRRIDQIDPVKSFRGDHSVYGLYDLAGNAREWCIDYFSPNAYSQAAASGPVAREWKGPRRTAAESNRVVRGGGPNWKSWHRAAANAQEQQPLIGFRCVLRLGNADKARGARKP